MGTPVQKERSGLCRAYRERLPVKAKVPARTAQPASILLLLLPLVKRAKPDTHAQIRAFQWMRCLNASALQGCSHSMVSGSAWNAKRGRSQMGLVHPHVWLVRMGSAVTQALPSLLSAF